MKLILIFFFCRSEYNNHFDNFLNQIYKGRFEKEDQIIADFKTKCVEIARDLAILHNFAATVPSKKDCINVAWEITHQAFKKATEKHWAKSVLLTGIPNVETKSSAEFKFDNFDDKIVLNDKKSDKETDEKKDEKIEAKEIVEIGKEKEAEEILEKIVNEATEPIDLINVESLNAEAANEEEKEEDLKVNLSNGNLNDGFTSAASVGNVSELSDALESASVNSRTPSFSYVKVDKLPTDLKKPETFFNVELEDDADETESSCSTIKSSETGSSMDSYEMIMSDSFDFEKINTDDNKEDNKEDNQSVLAMKSSTITDRTNEISVPAEMTNSQIMTSSRNSIYKSLIEPTSTPEECNTEHLSAISDSVTNKQDQQTKSNVFDFNNWTYLLEKNQENDLQNDKQASNKAAYNLSTNTLMSEFYDICKSKGLNGTKKEEDKN